MTNIVFKIASIAIICIITGCVSTVDVNKNAPPAGSKPNLIDAELKAKTTELIDAQNRLVNARKIKLDSLKNDASTESQVMSKKFSGLDTIRDINCQCDLKTAMQVIAINLNWDMNKVFELGRKPAQGVPVTIRQKGLPLAMAIESIDRQVGHFVDIRIDPNYETILIEYKALDTPRGGPNAK
ncbi:hypothetical protein JR728_003745 [Vibrio vulnificus]|nr:hypothetical protein [Vibrio vulnificus]